MTKQFDLFISYASADRTDYINPITEALERRHISFWLDSINVKWGDSIALQINAGLRSSRYVLLCLSKAYIGREWPETEMSAAFGIRNKNGKKRALPLILNSKDLILERYPLLEGFLYRTYDHNAEALAAKLSDLLSHTSGSQNESRSNNTPSQNRETELVEKSIRIGANSKIINSQIGGSGNIQYNAGKVINDRERNKK